MSIRRMTAVCWLLVVAAGGAEPADVLRPGRGDETPSAITGDSGETLPGPNNNGRPKTPSTENAVGDAAEKSKFRQREGAKFADRRGKFERRGDRYVFLAEDEKTHYIVLENLMLERVSGVLEEASGAALDWGVSGTVTEYRGANYLLLVRAVVKSAPDRREPRRLETPASGPTAAGEATRR